MVFDPNAQPAAPGSASQSDKPITLYSAKPAPGSIDALLANVFGTGNETQKPSFYKAIIESNTLTGQQITALREALKYSGFTTKSTKPGVAGAGQLANLFGRLVNVYSGAQSAFPKGQAPALGLYADQLRALGGDLNNQMTVAQVEAAAAKAARQQSSIDIISEHLANMGFTDAQLKQLAPFVAGQVHSGMTQTAVYANLRQTPQYAQRFPGNAQRIKQGLPALNEGTYIAYEDRVNELARSYGLPNGALTPQIIGNMIANRVSSDEFEKRVVAGYDAMQKADAGTLQALQQYYNLNPGDIVHYIIDPKNASAALERKVTAAKIGGDVQAAGLQSITRQQAEDFAKFQASKGVNVAQGIQQAGQLKGLTGTAPGQARQGLTQDQLLQGAIGTTTAAQQALTSAQQAEAAPLKAGGGDVANQKGVVGAGYAAAE
jgi:hypothetical protein